MGKVFSLNTFKKMTEAENKQETTIVEEKETQDNVKVEETAEASAQHKASRGEKKFKKSLVKMGLKQVEGINRVTLKTNKNFVLYIEDPDILKSTDNASAFQKPEEAKPPESDAKPEVKIEEEGNAEEEEDAGDIPEESINTLMEYANCSRAKAIRGLKKTDGDVVEAITLVS